jgi:hypothetical protein
MTVPASCTIDAGRISLAHLSSTSPTAISLVDAKILCSHSAFDSTNNVCPPLTSSDRNGNCGSIPPFSPLSSSAFARSKLDTNLGVSACACIWCTPTNGTPHAKLNPFATSIPVFRFALMPGPLVTLTKSGFFCSSLPAGTPCSASSFRGIRRVLPKCAIVERCGGR